MINLYFDPDVWGTVSDWVIVNVTTVTAYYLYQTLKSQKEVQVTQNELFKIESVRFRESVKPIFKYSKSSKNFVPDNESHDVIGIEITNENESLANFININFENTKNVHKVIIPIDYNPAPLKYLKKGDKAILAGFYIVDKTVPVENFHFEVTYQDISGVKYSQTISCLLLDEEFNIYPHLPISE